MLSAATDVSSPPAAARGFGKAILFGEHAVLHGAPAIAVAIERGVQASVRAGSELNRLSVPVWGLHVTERDTNDHGRAFRALLNARAPQRPLHVTAVVDLPPGGGLGCSAALGVAVARALDPDADTASIVERVMSWESVFHGRASGVDAAISAHGGCIAFRTGTEAERIQPARALDLCIGHSGKPSSTRTMVEFVARMEQEEPERADRVFNRILSLAAAGREAIERGEQVQLGQLMTRNHQLLAELGLVTPELDQLCELARLEGALGAKLTGAGGGGCVIALVDSRATAERVVHTWQSAGFHSFSTRVHP